MDDFGYMGRYNIPEIQPKRIKLATNFIKTFITFAHKKQTFLIMKLNETFINFVYNLIPGAYL